MGYELFKKIVLGKDLLILLNKRVKLILLGLGFSAVGNVIVLPYAYIYFDNIYEDCHLRGRYKEVATNSWQISLMAGPTFAGILFGFNIHWYWLVGLIVGLLVIVIAASRLKLLYVPTVNMSK